MMSMMIMSFLADEATEGEAGSTAVCGVGKNRFKKNQGTGDYYAGMAAAKKANKAAAAGKRDGSARAALKARAAEMGREKDAGKETKGGFWNKK